MQREGDGAATAGGPSLVRFDPEPRAITPSRTVTIIGQDPSVCIDGAVVRATVEIPTEPGGRLAAGPWGARFHVADYDATTRALVVPGDPAADVIGTATDAELATSPEVRAHNVYAIASRTLALFEAALGRRLSWAFSGHQLFLVPAAFAEANAFYDPDTGAVLFGYFEAAPDGGDGPKTTVFTALSHDVVAHETTHAILDGLRSRFEEPSLPDQAALHEAIADIVALLSVCSQRELVERLIEPTHQGEAWISDDELAAGKLAHNPLLGLADQVGAATHAHGGDALRRSVTMTPSPDILADPRYEEPHARGEILVAAVSQAFLGIWEQRLEGLRRRGQPVNRRRAAEEGAKAASHLLGMCIRAIDYLPPLDVSFADFHAALQASDAEMVPDDDLGYRAIVHGTFAAFGIVSNPPKLQPATGPSAFSYALLHAAELERRDEVARFLWSNAELLAVPIDQYFEVESVQPSVRVGPDGFVVHETVATYIQLLTATGSELRAMAQAMGSDLTVPDGVPADTRIQLQGGGTLIFDEYGRLKFHVPKPLFDWARQTARLAYLVRHGVRGKSGGFGSSSGLAKSQLFAMLHTTDEGDELW